MSADLRERAHAHAGDEPTREDGIGSGGADGGALDDDTQHEDGRADQDGVLAAEHFSEETRVQRSKPGTEFKDRG